MTNREWLETLTDEEMAELLVNDGCITFCSYVHFLTRKHSYCEKPKGKTCKDGICDWLKAEYKEENK